MNNKVSIIIPVYGVENFIERCAKSLFSQTLDGIEFIFVDDCTPDKSMVVLESVIEKFRYRIAEKSWTVRTEKMPANSGLPAVRRHGIQLSTGDYIIHCDSDDWVEPEMLEEMYNEAINSNADVVICDYCRTDGDQYHKVYKGCQSTEKDELIRNFLFQRNSWSLCNKLFRRTTYYKGLIYPEKPMGEDMATTIQLIWQCKNIRYIPKAYYNYYVNLTSITKQKSVSALIKMKEDLYANVSIVEDFLKSKMQQDVYKNELAYIKENCRSMLLPVIDYGQNRLDYLEMYPDLKYGIGNLFDKGCSLYAFRYLSVKYGFYTIASKLKSLF